MMYRLKYANIILLVCAAVSLVCYDIFGGLWLKGLTSCWFVILGAINLWAARHASRLRLFVLIEVGLICGMFADVMLSVAFFVGVGLFALGHILYLAAFCSQEKMRMLDLWLFLPPAAVAIFMIVGTPWVHVDDPLLLKIVIVYGLIISAMLAKAVSNQIYRPSTAHLLLAIGSALFWFSDLMLLIDMFGQSSRLTWIFCSYCYWPAQNITAHALYHAKLEHP